MDPQSNLCKTTDIKSDRCVLIENVPKAEMGASYDISFISNLLTKHCKISDSNEFGESKCFEQDANSPVDPSSCSSGSSSILCVDKDNIENNQINSTEDSLSITIPETDSEGGFSDGDWTGSIISIYDDTINSEERNGSNTNIENSKVETSAKDTKSFRANLNSTRKHETSSNQGRLTSEDDVNESAATTRAGRKVRQRLQLSIQSSPESDQSDYDFEMVEEKISSDSADSGASDSQHEPKHLMYLDLSKELVDKHLSAPTSVQVDDDESFKLRLKKFLGTASKRRMLYTQTYGDTYNDDFNSYNDNIRKSIQTKNRRLSFSDRRNDEKSVFKLHMPPHNQEECKLHKYLEIYLKKYDHKYNFIQSLDATIPEMLCHPKAKTFNADFSTHRKKLTSILYDLYNHKIFNCALNVKILWKQMFSKPSNCLNKSSKGRRGRTSIVEINSRLITSTKALRIVMLHELCHAAAWLFNGESGHGANCEAWLTCANQILPGLPRIDKCNRPAHLYTYICMMCDAKSQGSLTFELADRVRCNYCYGIVEIQTNTMDPHKLPESTRSELTGWLKFIKEHYSRVASTLIKHTEIMTQLNNDYLTGS